MKKSILVIALLTAPMLAQAASPQNIPHVELCELEEDYDDVAFTTVESFDVREMTSATTLQLALLNEHLFGNEYSQKALSLAEIHALFAKGGDYEYDDLVLSTIRSAKSGTLYYQTKSWPGDNPYGLLFDLAGKVVASNGDDSITLITPKGDISCWDLRNEKTRQKELSF